MDSGDNAFLADIIGGMDFVYKILLEYSKFVLIIIVGIVSAQVFSRKFIGTSILWSEEVALLMMVWMAFISMAIGVEKNIHISIEFFYNKMPVGVQKVMDTVNLLVTCAIGGIMAFYGTSLVVSTMSSTLAATQWPGGILYLMIPISGVFVFYFSVVRFFRLERYHWLPKDDEGVGMHD